jgi:RNA polymerase sigma factor (sigma-70 family)
MAGARAGIVRQLRFALASWKEDARADAELLRRFVQSRDEQAFSTLVGRYSELVWGVCQRKLRNAEDAEDALQATFLRLARDAGRIVNREALPGWLFRVARDCAVDLRRAADRRRRIEERAAEVADRAGAAPSADLRVLLDDELALLPAPERAVLVMCALEGRTYADAALALRCSVAAVHRRFVRAQTRLRRRFARHTPSAAGALAAVLAGGAGAASAAPAAVLAAAVEAGLGLAATGVMPAGRAGLLAAGSGAAVTPLQAVALAVGVAAVFAGALVVATPTPVAVRPSPELTAEARPAVTGVVRGPDGEPVPGAAVVVTARRPYGPGERGLRDAVLATGTADAAGRFAVPVPDDFDTWFADRVVTVRASAPGLAPVTAPARPAGGSVELRMAAGFPLRGRLVDPAGRPVAGAAVEVIRVGGAVAEPVIGGRGNPAPGWPAPVASGPDGTFALPAVGGSANVWVRVADPRFATETARLDRPDGPSAVVLTPARTVAVAVRAADTGAPLPGARLTLVTDRLSSHAHFTSTEHGLLGPERVPAEEADAVADARGVVRLGVAPGERFELLVHPPASDAPYVGVRTVMTAGPAGEDTVAVRLPRGRWVTGTVTDATGRPVRRAVAHWAPDDAARPEWRNDHLVGRDSLARTGDDGTFRLAVLPGPVSVRVFGPTLDFPATPAAVAGTRNTTLFAHHVARLDVPADGPVPAVRATLRPGTAVAVRVEHPDGPGEKTFFLASGRVSPVRPYSALPLRLKGGFATVPGCGPGVATRVYVLDPVRRLGAVADVTAGGPAPGGVTLVPCGRARVRLLGPGADPLAGQEVRLSLLLDRDHPAGEGAASDPQPADWFDPVNYAARPVTAPDGVAELPALIPGARYTVAAGAGVTRTTSAPFRAAPGELLTLPDLVLTDPTPEAVGGR